MKGSGIQVVRRLRTDFPENQELPLRRVDSCDLQPKIRCYYSDRYEPGKCRCYFETKTTKWRFETGGLLLEKLNNAQKKKKAIYLECMAIKEAIRYWQHWLVGKRFTVFTDSLHKPFENLNIRSRTDEELGALTLYLSQFDFNIKYAPGSQNQEADCLSRNPVLEANSENEKEIKIMNFITIEELREDKKNIKKNSNEYELILESGVKMIKIKNRKKILISSTLAKKTN